MIRAQYENTLSSRSGSIMFLVCVVANVSFMCIDHYKDLTRSHGQDGLANHCFTLMFAGACAQLQVKSMRILAVRVNSGINCFEAIIVLWTD